MTLNWWFYAVLGMVTLSCTLGKCSISSAQPGLLYLPGTFSNQDALSRVEGPTLTIQERHTGDNVYSERKSQNTTKKQHTQSQLHHERLCWTQAWWHVLLIPGRRRRRLSMSSRPIQDCIIKPCLKKQKPKTKDSVGWNKIIHKAIFEFGKFVFYLFSGYSVPIWKIK